MSGSWLMAVVILALGAPDPESVPARIRVDVTLSDRDGQPVLDLEPDELMLRVDGEVRPITSVLRVLHAPPAAGGETAAAGDAVTPRHVAVLYDQTSVSGRHRGRFAATGPELALWAEQGLAAVDRLSVVIFRHELRVLLWDRPNDAETRAVLAEAARLDDSTLPEPAQEIPVGDVIEGIGALAASLEPMRGRKAILVVSEGRSPTRLRDLTDREETGFESSDVMVSVLLTTGLQPFGRSDSLWVHPWDGTTPNLPDDWSGGSRYGQGALLNRVADATQGRFVRSVNKLSKELKHLSATLSSYYEVSFEPAEEKSRRLRKLQVRVSRKGVRVRHRKGYVALP